MTDELSVQQPSKTPYVLTTGVVGAGAGAALGAWKPGWAKEPSQYATYEDLVKEKKDTFEDAAKEKEQSIVDKAKEARAEIEKYDADFEAYKKANAGGAAQTKLPDGHELLGKEADAQKALDAAKADYDKALADKIAELKKAEGEKTVEKIVPAKPNNNLTLRAKIVKEEAEIARLKQVNSDVEAALNRELNKLAAQLSEVSGKDAVELDAKINERLTKIVNEFYGSDPAKINEFKQLIQEKAQILDLPKGALETTERVLEKVSPEKLEGYANAAERRAANLERLNEIFEKYMKDSSPKERKLLVTRIIEGTSDGKPITLVEKEYAPEEVKEIKSFFDRLSAEDKKLFKSYIGKDEADAVKIANELAKYRKMAEEYRTAINTLKQTDSAKISVKLPESPQIFRRQQYLDRLIKQRDGVPRKVIEHTPGLSEEEIAKKAREAVSDAAIKEKQGALDGIKKEVEKAIAELPKATEKAEDVLKAEFEKANGTREKVVADAIEKFGKDISKDAGKIKGSKLGWIIAAGAGIGLVLGAIIAPKNKA